MSGTIHLLATAGKHTAAFNDRHCGAALTALFPRANVVPKAAGRPVRCAGDRTGSLGDFAIIVVGASQGGVDALQMLVAGLPRNIPAGLFVVQHIGRQRSQLPQLLASRSRLPAMHAETGQAVRPGCIHVAPPDHHLILQTGIMRLTRGPRENWARPAIDPLFRSAAAVYGRRVIGVILTGGLNDGTAGLHAVRQHGGIAVVQHPRDAACPEMPVSALRHAGADYCIPLRDMPPLLARLAEDIANNQPNLQISAGGRSHDTGV